MEWVVLMGRAVGESILFEEVARVEAPQGRPAAWEAAKAAVPSLVPSSAGEVREAHLVPATFWRPVRSLVQQPPVVPVVEGL